jgi:peptidoglycan/LPS O-acetylase OafA/YrhL
MRAKLSFPPGYLPTLDGWRAISILLVIFYHGFDSMRRACGPRIDFLAPFAHLGWVGVCIFFGLSGVLITSRLLEEQARRGSIDLWKFYLRRVFRILPPILLLLGVFSILATWFHLPASLPDRLRALFFASNYGPGPGWYLAHTWSLSLEEHFYLIWPMVLVTLGWSRSIVFALVASAIITLWRILDIHYQIVPPSIGASPWRTDANLDYLLLSAVVGCWLNRPRSRAVLQSLLPPLMTLILLASLFGAIAVVPPYPHVEHPVRCYVAVVIPLILAGTILHPGSLLGLILEWSWLRWLGRLSYSLYLWQQLFFVSSQGRLDWMGWLQQWPGNFFAALACAAVSYYLVERPCLKLGHRLAPPVSEGRSDLGGR